MPAEAPIALATEAAPDDFTTTYLFVLAYLFERGEATRPEVEEALDVSHDTANRALKAAVAVGLARETDGPETGKRGRNPALYVATPPGDDGVAELTKRQVKDRAVEALAHLHYRTGWSAAHTRRLSRETGIDVNRLVPAMRALVENGVVEVVNPDSGSSNRYRLTGAGEYVTYRDRSEEVTA